MWEKWTKLSWLALSQECCLKCNFNFKCQKNTFTYTIYDIYHILYLLVSCIEKKFVVRFSNLFEKVKWSGKKNNWSSPPSLLLTCIKADIICEEGDITQKEKVNKLAKKKQMMRKISFFIQRSINNNWLIIPITYWPH